VDVEIEKAIANIRGSGQIRLTVRMGKVVEVAAHRSAPSRCGLVNLAILVAFVYTAIRAYASGGLWRSVPSPCSPRSTACKRCRGATTRGRTPDESQTHAADVEAVMRESYPRFVVSRTGKFLQERAVVQGFHWESPPFVWVRDVRRATKYPRTIARIVAVEVGGVAAAVSDLEPASPSPSGS
jgi:hypothetical protein